MSVVTVTALPAGSLAASADVNATLNSFVTATAAGALNGINFAMEGIDRRPLNIAGAVVEQGGNANFKEETASAAVTSVGYAVIPLDGGAAPMVMPSGVTAPSTAMLVLHASVRVSCGAIAATINLPQVWCQLEQSTNGGGVYTKLTGSERTWRMRNTGALCDPTPGTSIPGIEQTISWSQYVATTNVSTLYRATYRTQNGAFTFTDGIISPEVILR